MRLSLYLPIIVLGLAVILIQLLTQWADSAYYLTQLTMSAYYSIVVIGLCMVMGYAGQISLGHAGFFAIGGYLSASLTTCNLIKIQDNYFVSLLDHLGMLNSGTSLYGEPQLYFNPWVACILAIVTAAAIAFLIGIPVLKLKGHYLAMATLGFGIIIYRIVLAVPFFGEADGISGVPGFPIFPGVEVSGDFSARVSNYYVAWSLVILGMILLISLINSRVGRGLKAIHGSEEAARAMGIDTSRYKLNAFVISAVFAAIAGVFLTHYNGGIGPSEAGIMKSVRYVALVAAGGMASLWGALTMSVLLNFMSLRGMFGAYDDAVFGIILILIMLFAPEGLLRLTLYSKMKSLLSSLTRPKTEKSPRTKVE